MDGFRLPCSAHTSRPWRIHELTRDFAVEDVWALPTPGRAGDFSRLVEVLAAFKPASSPVRALLALRWRLGALLQLDRPATGDVPSLRDRLPADLQTAGPAGVHPFRSLYLTGDEWALEIANRTMHGVLHVGWVRIGLAYRGQMAVLVKRNGVLGAAYMAAIKPFRHVVVYPRLGRDLARAWRA
jgi:hypothetical protein